MWLTLNGDSMGMMELTDYMQRYMIDRFAVIPGVSQINIFGSGGPSMRVWIDRLALGGAQFDGHRHRSGIESRESRIAGRPHRVARPRFPSPNRAQLSNRR